MSINLLIIASCVVFGAAALAAEPATLDLISSEIPADAKSYRIAVSGSNIYLQSGVPRKDVATGIVSFLAVSPVNPGVAPDSSVDKFFGPLQNRPLTWRDATAACNTYKGAGKDWQLPSTEELLQLNFYLDYGTQILESESEAVAPLKTNWTSLQDRMLPQFNFFWTKSTDKKSPAGLKQAGFFGKNGKYQNMSEARPLSYVCVTYFSGPARELDIAMPATDSENERAKKG